ncbi:phosphoribosylformylglycinamidine synthase [Granulicella aggregans]|uniref:Phosphoribosylformylglycinamidine synthase subunit PurL n=1 Tax=Granulicella aggregans TaxID=474949 RepID=A0A7W7ZEU9_9BACT|nr:phosphoribosylformylglycinamidine synthase subunit PurL [Granulicella aggregans]MBB5058319.1 phosphoribosylformylglycinamidine synthase [Granulicella aggregans]
MANLDVQQAIALPSPATITPALLKTHSITPDEYARIEKALGRTPSLTELGIFSVMWSEHCSYKSSRVHLKRLPTKGTRTSGPGSVVQGPGENAGIIDVGDGWACAFKIESHNHPSYIEPYQGAATGVGGILRDIFTMNARPLAVMDSLRFGPLEGKTEGIDYARNRQTMSGVVHGVGGYGNCFGVPNLGGETRFEECYSGNPLLNAFALGLVKIDEIFYAKATGVGNPVIYVGAKTGRDGIHGATMASEEFTEGSEQKRPNVQMGDPFLEKLLLEACLEAMATGAVLGIQDMGAAGLTCSTCEMGARGELGLTIELDLVPQRETGMSSYEIMLSESQERMLLVADKGREGEVLRVFEKWGLDASIVGIVTADDTMRVTHHGELVCEIPNKALTDDAPVYHRPVGAWKAPVPLDPPAWVLEELKKPRDYTADLKKLLASANICSKHWIFEQYDSMVQTNTVQGPGGEAGVMRIKGTGGAQKHSFLEKVAELIAESTPEGEAAMEADPAGASEAWAAKPERGLAMALAGNGRWTYLDPKLGAMHAVAEAARKVACTGATPVAATNCLNFGNPEKPEIMAQLSAAIDGIAEACTALGTPITGGNVSLYNETKGEGIYPTPVLGVVGILDDVTKAVPSGFQNVGDRIIVAQFNQQSDLWRREFGSSEFAKEVLGVMYGTPPLLNVNAAAYCNQLLQDLSQSGLVHSLADIGSGGLATAIAKAAFDNQIGAEVWLHSDGGDESATEALFIEHAGSILITCSPENADEVTKRIEQNSSFYVALPIGETVSGRVEIRWERETAISTALSDLGESFSNALESQLAAEVLA